MRDLYDDAVQRIKKAGDHVSFLAIRALAWLLNVKRNLTMDELLHAITALPETQFSVDANEVMLTNMLVAACHGLLVHDEKTGEVRLIRES